VKRADLLLLLGGVFLVSCGDDQTSSTGGTGSDFPIHPAIAIVQERNGSTIQAASWRLWSVSRDSVHYKKELAPTDSGFLLPDTGSWLVEAWASPENAGKTTDLAAQPLDKSYERCLNWIGRNTSSASPSPAILGACSELASPTVLSHGTTQGTPRAIAAFRLPSPGVSGTILRDSLNRIVSARAWRLWKATGDSTGPFAIFHFAGYQSGGEPGILETSGLSGTWVAQGWVEAPSDTLYRTPAYETGLETTLLDLCLGSSAFVAPRLCTEQLFDETQYGTGQGQLVSPSVQAVFRIPSKD